MIRTGIGFDAHRFGPGRRLVLGGVEIPGAPGLEGHSDADVLCHAIMDAILGAAADGDIGGHFPDTDPAWKGARSVWMLETVVRRAAALGYRVANVDATVIAEAPRLAPHVPAMRAALAAALGAGAGRVSIKATTVEGMGALGRGEGMAALAVATLDNGPPGESE